MSLRIFAVLFGLAFIAVGIAGFFPTLIDANGNLFGIFMVDPFHNSIHLISGIIALLAATNPNYAKWYFRLFGLIYALVAIVGFWHGNLFNMMQVNTADNILHLVIAIIALYLGFVFKTV